MDTETYVHRVEGNKTFHRLRLGHALYQRWRPSRSKHTEHWLEFTEPVEFWEWLDATVPHRATVWVMSCNLAFDFHILDGWKYIPAQGAKVQFYYAGFKTTIIQCRALKRRLLFIDTINVLPVSVAKLGEHLGLPKMDIDWRSKDTELVSAYCRRDVEIIRDGWNGFCDFIEGNDFGPVSMTLASQAMNTFSYRFMKQPIFIHGNEKVCALERAGYFGGRTEALHIGRYDRSQIFVLDVNAMYPAVMRNNMYPYRFKGSGRHLPLRALPDKLDRYAVVARVRLDTDEPAYPYRGVRTLFPIGKFTTTLTMPELRYAVQHGHVREVLEWADYDKDDLFTEYVDTVLALRKQYAKQNNALYVFICKRLSNSFYGKFGQLSTEWIDAYHNGTVDSYAGIYHDTVTGKSSMERCFFGWVQREGDTTESRNSFPAICAHVTGYARMRLWSLMKRVPPHQLLYVDTDSLMVTPRGMKALAPEIKPKQTGKLKLEDVYKWIEIYTTKDYKSDKAVKLKGVPASAEEIRPGVYRHEWFPGFATMLRERISGEFPIITTVKTLKREYLKGNISKQGWVTPFTFQE